MEEREGNLCLRSPKSRWQCVMHLLAFGLIGILLAGCARLRPAPPRNLEPLLRSIQSVLTDFPIREGLPSHLCPQLFGTLMAV